MGMTESISRRVGVASLITQGAEPAWIVAFTSTERAVAELKKQIARRVEECSGADFPDRLSRGSSALTSATASVLQGHVPASAKVHSSIRRVPTSSSLPRSSPSPPKSTSQMSLHPSEYRAALYSLGVEKINLTSGCM